jgi:hypothetical protein
MMQGTATDLTDENKVTYAHCNRFGGLGAR